MPDHPGGRKNNRELVVLKHPILLYIKDVAIPHFCYNRDWMWGKRYQVFEIVKLKKRALTLNSL